MLVIVIIAVGVLAALGMVFAARGPSAGKAVKRRIEMIRERHGDVIAANAQAQIRKLFAQRASKVEGLASSIIPKPALLRKRLEQTGREISLAKYAMVTIGLTHVIAVGLMAGWRLRCFAGAAGLLLMIFGLAMTTAIGPKPPLDYSVFVGAAAAFLLAAPLSNVPPIS